MERLLLNNEQLYLHWRIGTKQKSYEFGGKTESGWFHGRSGYLILNCFGDSVLDFPALDPDHPRRPQSINDRGATEQQELFFIWTTRQQELFFIWTTRQQELLFIGTKRQQELFYIWTTRQQKLFFIWTEFSRKSLKNTTRWSNSSYVIDAVFNNVNFFHLF